MSLFWKRPKPRFQIGQLVSPAIGGVFMLRVEGGDTVYSHTKPVRDRAYRGGQWMYRLNPGGHMAECAEPYTWWGTSEWLSELQLTEATS